MKESTASPLGAVTALAAMGDEHVLDLGQEQALAVVELTQAGMAALAAVQALAVEAFTRREEQSLAECRRRRRARGESSRGIPVAEEVVPAMLAPALHVAPRTAATLVGETRVLVGELPVTFALARAGRLEMSRARLVASAAGLVSPGLREQFEREVVQPDRRFGRTPLVDLSSGAVRRRAARTAVRVDPVSAADRAQLCRAQRFVRVCPGEVPGISNWAAALPSGTSLLAWAAIEALAAEYVAADSARSVSAARADAMTDLILARATITTTVDLVVPAPTTPTTPATPTVPTVPAVPAVPSVPAVPTGPGAGSPAPSRPGASRPGAWRHDEVYGSIAEVVYLSAIRARRQVAAPNHRPRRRSGDGEGGSPRSPGGAPTDCRVGVAQHRVGIILNATVTAWLADPDTRLRLHEADPVTGTLLRHDPTIYRPGAALARTVRARDGHCRFPGCTTDARRCHLDHVTRFPDGPTTLDNLTTLCPTHHAFKHHAGWTLTMTPDATCTWTSPLHRTYTTTPTTTHDLAA